MKSSKGASGQFKCSHCSKQFKYDSDKKRHEASHSPHFKCDVCTKKFSYISALKRHQKQHQRAGSVECSDCGKKFKDAALLKRHIEYAHKGTFLCSTCKATFSSELALRNHKKTHNPASTRKYVCSLNGCGKSFNFSHHLKHHELTHNDVKQYFCSICKKGFIQSHHLKAHMKTHDPDKWLYCSWKSCKKKFATEYSRKRHAAMHKKQESRIITGSGLANDTSLSRDLNTDKKILDKITDEKEALPSPWAVSPKECEYRELECRNYPESKNLTNELNEATLDIDYEVTSCKTALGQCIMDGETNCLCAQITQSDVKYTPTKNLNNNEFTRHKKPSHSDNDIKTCIPKNVQACDTCHCDHRKKFEWKNICPNANKTIAVLPDIDYTDGVVKLRDTVDGDIAERCKEEAISAVSYTSCKAVLGNCIVSGNGTMGEGCLCAKMFADDQAMEQEIDDITPRPKY